MRWLMRAFRLQSHSHRFQIAFLSAIIALAGAQGVQAQGPPPSPLQFAITTGSLSPGDRCIYGTMFPWYDRLGNFVTTLRGGFGVSANYPNQLTASQITVVVDGWPA